MKVRPISILSVPYRLYAKARLATLEGWLSESLPGCVWSYIPGQDVRVPLMNLASRIERSQKPMATGDTILLSLDLSKAFSLCVPGTDVGCPSPPGAARSDPPNPYQDAYGWEDLDEDRRAHCLRKGLCPKKEASIRVAH